MTSTISTTTALMDLFNSLSGQAQTAATQAASSTKEIWFSFLGINWSTPTWDIVILLFIVISVVIYSFTLGRDRIVDLLISTYLALAVTTNLPYMDKISAWINSLSFLTIKVSAFLVVFAVLFIMLSRSSILQGVSNLSGGWWQIILFSLLQVGLLVSIILSFLPKEVVSHLSDFTQIIFLSDLGKFCWIILPILALIFFQGKKQKIEL